MKILIVTQNFLMGGLETQIQTYCEHLKKSGHEIFMATSTNSKLHSIKNSVSEFLLLNHWDNRTGDNILTLADKIKKFILDHNINVVHLHPFESMIIGSLAARLAKVPYVVTIHGPVSLSPLYGPIYRLFLKNCLFSTANKIYGVSPEIVQLVKGIDKEGTYKILPNPLNVDRFSPATVDHTAGKWAIVSRLDNDKVPGIINSLELLKVAKEKGYFKDIWIYGDGNAKEVLLEWIKNNVDDGKWITLLGASTELEKELSRGFSGVIGMGRVVLEAGSMNLPILLAGYDGIKGLITRDNVEEAFQCNFSGRNLVNCSLPELFQSLDGLNNGLKDWQLRQWVIENCAIEGIMQHYMTDLEQAIQVNKESEWELKLVRLLSERKDINVFDPIHIESWYEYMNTETNEIAMLLNELNKEREQGKGLLFKVAQLEQNLHDLNNYKQASEIELKEQLKQQEIEKLNFYNDLKFRMDELVDLSNEIVKYKEENARLNQQITELQNMASDTTDLQRFFQREFEEATRKLEEINKEIVVYKEENTRLNNEVAGLHKLDNITSELQKIVQLELEEAGKKLFEFELRNQLDLLTQKIAQVENRNQHLEGLQKHYVEALDWNKNALDTIYMSKSYKIGRVIAHVTSPIKVTKKVGKRLLKFGFDLFKDRVSPDFKRKLKPYLSSLYYKVYPEKRRMTPTLVHHLITTEMTSASYETVATLAYTDAENEQKASAYFQDHMKEKVSVILPVYNHADMLEKSIQSVLNQTYPNIELVILNDGSTDGIESILSKYFYHPKVKIVTQRNQKLPRALTNAFEHATGDLYTWTSADNVCKPQMIEKLVWFMRNNPDVDLVYANYEIIDENDNPIFGTEHRYHNQNPKGSNFMSLPWTVETLGLIEDNFIGAAFMYRSEVARVIGEYDPCLVGTEDYDYWLRINELFTVKRFDSEESLYYYRVHSNSLSEKFGKSHIWGNVPILLKYNRQRKDYYNIPFDVYILAGDKLNTKLMELVDGFSKNRQNVYLISDEILLDQVKAPIKKISSLSKDLLNFRYTSKAILVVDDSHDGDETVYEQLKEAYSEDLFVVSFKKGFVKANWFLGSDVHKEEYLLKKFLFGETLEESDLLRKARDNRYYLWDYHGTGEKILGYFGPLQKNLIDVNLIKTIAENRPEYDIVLIGIDGESDHDFIPELGYLPNVYLLGHKNEDLQYYYLSGFDVYLLPIKKKEKTSQQRGLKALLHAGKPVLTSISLTNRNLPYLIEVGTGLGYLEELDQLRNITVNTELLDKYLNSFVSTRKAYMIEALASNYLFYQKTRGPEKKRLGIIEEPAVAFSPEKVNLLIEAQSLDKGGLEEVIFNTLKTIDLKCFNPIVVCIYEGGYVAKRCQQLGFRVVVLSDNKVDDYVSILDQHNIHLVHQHYSTFGAQLAAARNIPVIHFIHNSYVWFSEQDALILVQQDQYISSYIAVSQEVKEYSISRFNLPAGKIHVIPNGINTDWLREKFEQPQKIYRSDYGLSEKDFVLLNLASIDGRKAQLLTIHVMKEIVAQYPDIKVLMCGNTLDHSYYQKCQNCVQEFGLEQNVIFTGFVKDNQDLFRISDVFLMPSIIEGWSISKTEAMFAGKPLLMTDVGGARHVVEDEDIGILIPNAYGDVAILNDQTLYTYTLNGQTRNFDDLKKAILRMYSEKDIWKEKGKKGTEKVLLNYNLVRIVRNYEELSKKFIFKQGYEKNIVL